MGRRRGGGATLGERVVFNFNLKLSLPLLLLCFFFFFCTPPPPLLSLCSLPDGPTAGRAAAACRGRSKWEEEEEEGRHLVSG